MEWLKSIRAERGMTGEAVGVQSGISQQYYNFIENGKRCPSVAVAKRIAEILDFDWTKFFETEDESDAS